MGIINVNFTTNREYIVQKLQEGILEVTFTKVNGEERVLTCSLMQNLLPVPNEIDNIREGNPSIISVWDLEKDAWRAFRLDSVIQIRTMEADGNAYTPSGMDVDCCEDPTEC